MKVSQYKEKIDALEAEAAENREALKRLEKLEAEAAENRETLKRLEKLEEDAKKVDKEMTED